MRDRQDDESYMVICDKCGPIGTATGSDMLREAAEQHAHQEHGTPADVYEID